MTHLSLYRKLYKKITYLVTFAIFATFTLFATGEQTTDVWTKQGNFALSTELIDLARKENSNINTPYFYTDFIRNPDLVRNYLLDKNGKNSQEETCKTTDGETIYCNYIDNDSDTLLIVGPGFTNPKETMIPFVGMFNNYDIVLFDHRGHHYYKSKWLNPFSWNWRPSRALFGFNGSKIKLGQVEHKDVIAVVKKFRKKKTYKQICGLGLCYSALTFIKAQAIYKKDQEEKDKKKNLFDKLICDGTWLSLEKRIEIVRKDIGLLNDPQNGGGSVSHCLGNYPLMVKTLQKIAETISQISLHGLDINILDYISNIDIPIFFLHGKEDLFVPLDEFTTIWEHVKKTYKTIALITNTKHVQTHFQEKELYKLFVELAIDLPYQTCLDYLQDASSLQTYLITRYFDRLDCKVQVQETGDHHEHSKELFL